MAKKPRKTPEKIDPNKLKTRDYLMVVLISGATKAGTHRDLRREESKNACRRKVHTDEY